MTAPRNGPPPRDGGSRGTATPAPHKGSDSSHTTNALPDSSAVESQAVSWWSVREHIQPFIDAVGTWPMVGTPAWCLLADDDPRKLAALYDAAMHWAVRVETCQQAHAEASRDISAAADWSAVAARDILRRNEIYIPRRIA
jgi:hypothetical protein